MKTSQKRKKQIKKMIRDRKIKKLSKSKNIPKIKKSPPSWFSAQIKRIIHRQTIDFPCAHVLVSSSSFLRFLKGQFNIRKAHGFLFGGFNHGVGLAGEQAFAKINDAYVHNPFGISKRLPFLCSTPDFIMKEEKIFLVEIKTLKTIEGCKELFKNVPNEYLFQIWISLEIFGLTKACLFIYLYEENSRKKNKFGTTKQVSLFGKIHINLKDLNLLQEISILTINRYLEYLKSFFATFKITVTKEDISEAKRELELCFSRHKRLKTTIKDIGNLIIKKNMGIVTEDCFKALNYTPEVEKFGTESRIQHDKEYYKNLKNCLERRKIKLLGSKFEEKTIELNKDLIDKGLKTEAFAFDN